MQHVHEGMQNWNVVVPPWRHKCIRECKFLNLQARRCNTKKECNNFPIPSTTAAIPEGTHPICRTRLNTKWDTQSEPKQIFYVWPMHQIVPLWLFVAVWPRPEKYKLLREIGCCADIPGPICFAHGLKCMVTTNRDGKQLECCQMHKGCRNSTLNSQIKVAPRCNHFSTICPSCKTVRKECETHF